MTTLAVLIMVVLFAAPSAQATTSAVGKTISTVSRTSDDPAMTVPSTPVDFLAVAVPKRYRTDRHFLKITTSYQAWCYQDVTYATIDIAGAGAQPDPSQGFFTDREGADHAPISFTTRQWFVAPSSFGGPSIPPGAVVTLKLMSDVGTGCTTSVGTMVLEIAR